MCASLPKIYYSHSAKKKRFFFGILIDPRKIAVNKRVCESIPLAILISACFGKYFHCTVKWVDRFQRCDIIFQKYSCIGPKLRIDRKLFEYHNGIFAPMSSTIQHDVQVRIGSHSDQYQPPEKLKIQISINANFCQLQMDSLIKLTKLFLLKKIKIRKVRRNEIFHLNFHNFEYDHNFSLVVIHK